LEESKITLKWLASSIKVARIGGVDIQFHFSMLFSLFITWFIFRPLDVRGVVLALLWLSGFILSILFHELGHAFVAKLVGVEVKGIFIWLLGGLTNLTRKPEKPSHNLAISAAGPLVNMLMGFLLVLIYIVLYLLIPRAPTPSAFIWMQTSMELCFSLAFLNVILVFFNLLPIYPLDGGNILHALLDGLFGKASADLITMLVSIPVLLCLIAFGVYTRDFLLLGSCILIALAVGTLNQSTLRGINLTANYLFKRSGYYFLQGDFERAAQLFTLEIEKEPLQPNHYLARAACLLNIMQKERALADVERALKLAPESPVALQLRGEIYSMNKDHDTALEYYARVQAINPAWAVPYFDRGSILLDKKEFGAALTEFNTAISLTSQFPLFYVVRSLAHFKLGNQDATHQDQNTAIHLSEKDALTVAPVNLTLYEGYLDWAEDFYAHVLSKRPRSAYAYQGRADAYRVNHEYEKAIPDYTKAIELNPRESESYLGRGKCHQVLNNVDKAVADFQHLSATAFKLHLKKQADELLKVMNQRRSE
jgi:tetratricopeptide (TPR) repeat protein